ncbi:MAG: 3-isopropylmalate dehydratase large subunit [bacterium]|nr:3-isopropylmalate dehydratase large subunit [bacterium]
MVKMTIAEKILARHSGNDAVIPGQLIECDLDLVLANDVTAPISIAQFEKLGIGEVFDRSKIVLVADHYVPNKDIKSAINAKVMRDFALKYGIEYNYDVGTSGIEHALLPEQGLVTAGDLVIGADSHTCTYGALNAFSTGMGSTDIAIAFATGRAWFKVPESIKVVLSGQPAPDVSGKDIILSLIGMIGVDGALYKALEFCGDALDAISMEQRMTICNMGIECGAKAAIFVPDSKTREYLDGRAINEARFYEPDDGAEYAQTIEIDCSKLEPVLAVPHSPSNVESVSQHAGVRLDQVVIGSCTNGRIEDMRAAAEVLAGRRVAPGIRCIVIPATQDVVSKCLEEGLAKIFIDAGCAFSTPTCGPCLGGHMGVLAPGEVAISTTNRNFVGRMGDTSSKVYLASPRIAAASAVLGRIGLPSELG